MAGSSNLEEAKDIFLDVFGSNLKGLHRQADKLEYKFTFSNGIVVYIQYNDFGEYSYLILFSNSEYDRLLYDNFDDLWDVETQPHHFHPRDKKEAIRSPMIGKPEQDIPKLVSELKKYVLQT